MLRYISIFLLIVGITSCEKEPFDIEVQPPSDTLTIYTMITDSYVYDPATNITTVTYRYSAWDSFDMPVYIPNWLATNPSSTTQTEWEDWALDSTNSNPDYYIYTTAYYLGLNQVSYYDADYRYNQENKSDLIANGDSVIQL